MVKCNNIIAMLIYNSIDSTFVFLRYIFLNLKVFFLLLNIFCLKKIVEWYTHFIHRAIPSKKYRWGDVRFIYLSNK